MLYTHDGRTMAEALQAAAIKRAEAKAKPKGHGYVRTGQQRVVTDKLGDRCIVWRAVPTLGRGKYSGAKLRELRAERGVGRPRYISGLERRLATLEAKMAAC